MSVLSESVNLWGEPLLEAETKSFGEFALSHSSERYSDHGDSWIEHQIKALDGSKEAGKYSFQERTIEPIGDILTEDNVYTKPEYQKKGIATAAYVWIEEITGLKVRPNGSPGKNGKWIVSGYHQTNDAKKLWANPKRPFGIPNSQMTSDGVVFEAAESKLDAILTPHMMQLLCSWMENDYSGSDISAIVDAPWPPEVRGADGKIYRGEGLTQANFEKLKAGTYKARGSSWTTDFKTASAFAHDDNGWEGNERVHRFVFVHDGNKNDVALNFEKLASTPEFKERWEKGDIKMCSPEEGVRSVDEKEVLTKKLLPLSTKNIIKVYVGEEWEPVDPDEYLEKHGAKR